MTKNIITFVFFDKNSFQAKTARLSLKWINPTHCSLILPSNFNCSWTDFIQEKSKVSSAHFFIVFFCPNCSIRVLLRIIVKTTHPEKYRFQPFPIPIRFCTRLTDYTRSKFCGSFKLIATLCSCEHRQRVHWQQWWNENNDARKCCHFILTSEQMGFPHVSIKRDTNIEMTHFTQIKRKVNKTDIDERYMKKRIRLLSSWKPTADVTFNEQDDTDYLDESL